MEVTPQIFTAKVMHKRSFPKVNRFTYSIYYLALPLSQLFTQRAIKVNRAGLLNLREKDYGARDGSDIQQWARARLNDYGMGDEVEEILFITMPRTFGYGFNPVSFYLAMDGAGQLRAFIAEVHNTFGESHSYIGAHKDGRAMTSDDWLEAEKIFHVSPFLERSGSYRFRIAHEAEGKLGIWIDYVNANGQTQLFTSLIGTLRPLTRAALLRQAWVHPLVTMRAIALIHWQAVKLVSKKIRYICKPEQTEPRISTTKD